jgi:hypothetical protein
MNENSEWASSEFASGYSLATRNLFSQEFPMGRVMATKAVGLAF